MRHHTTSCLPPGPPPACSVSIQRPSQTAAGESGEDYLRLSRLRIVFYMAGIRGSSVNCPRTEASRRGSPMLTQRIRVRMHL